MALYFVSFIWYFLKHFCFGDSLQVFHLHHLSSFSTWMYLTCSSWLMAGQQHGEQQVQQMMQ